MKCLPVFNRVIVGLGLLCAFNVDAQTSSVDGREKRMPSLNDPRIAPAPLSVPPAASMPPGAGASAPIVPIDMCTPIGPVCPYPGRTGTCATSPDPSDARDPMRSFASATITCTLPHGSRMRRVRFIGGDPTLVARVRAVAVEWTRYASVDFQFVQNEPSDIRVAFNPLRGHWSYVGACTGGVAPTEPTMNLGFANATPIEQELRRVVLHEFGHALGLNHEHQSPSAQIPWNLPKVYEYFEATQGWNRTDTDRNVLRVSEPAATRYTTFDPSSIMLYPIPRELTLNGYSTGWNRELSQMDKHFLMDLYGARPWMRFRSQTATALHPTGPNFKMLIAANGDVFAIKKSRTGSGTTEVHVLEAASNYTKFSLQTGTKLHETGDNWDFVLAPNRDVVAIARSGTGSRSTELHVLSAADRYQSFSLQTGTALEEGGDFAFAMNGSRDLFAIKRSATESGKTEVHILSSESGYRSFVKQVGTALHETKGHWAFALNGKDLVAFKKSGTETRSTELHILDGASNYQRFREQSGSALHETDADFEFGVSSAGDVIAIKKNGASNKTEVHVLRR